MDKQKIKQYLNKIGFNYHEISVYITLLELGLSSAGPIIKKTGLHRNIVYETLHKLCIKKLVAESNKRGVKHFITTNPSKILEEKENHFNIARALVPQLELIRKKEKIDVSIYRGTEDFQSVHVNAINSIGKNKTIYVNGAGGKDFFKHMGETIKYFDKTRLKNNNVVKIISYRGRKDEMVEAQKRFGIKIKYLPIEFINPTGSSVFGSRVLLFVYSNDPIVIEVDSKSAAKAYVDSFNQLWKTAK